MMSRRSILLAADTASVAAVNAAVLILGARLFDAGQLNQLAMFQLLMSTAVGLQRASILTPAMAAQRTEGQTHIPRRWLAYICLPYGFVAAPLIPLLVGDSDYVSVLAVTVIGLAPAIIQDFLRYAAFSRGSVLGPLLSDLVWLTGFVLGVFGAAISGQLQSWTSLSIIWGVSGLCAILSLAFLPFWRTANTPRATLRATARLGKWSGADAALSGAANLLPMAIAVLALNSPAAAIYRILQTASGPLNIVSATFLTSFGLNAWTLSSVQGLRELRKRTLRASCVLAVGSAIYYSFAFPALLLLSGLSGFSWDETLRVALILAITGVTGAATIPFTAASTAMGYQRVGLIVRIFIVSCAVAVSLGVAVGMSIPWNDPVGTVAIISAVLGALGWVLGYEAGYRREKRTL